MEEQRLGVLREKCHSGCHRRFRQQLREQLRRPIFRLPVNRSRKLILSRCGNFQLHTNSYTSGTPSLTGHVA